MTEVQDIIINSSILHLAGSSSPMRLRGMVARPTEKPMKARMTRRSGREARRPGLARLTGSWRWSARPAMEADTHTLDTASSTRRPARSISARDTKHFRRVLINQA